MAKKSDMNVKVITSCDNLVVRETENRIRTIRGVQVILDYDLAELYGVETRALNQAVTRNLQRFPDDFRFQLTKEETSILKSQIVTSSWGLRSPEAISTSVAIMKAFVAMRRFMVANAAIFQRLEAVELRQLGTDKKIGEILNRLDDGSLKPKLGIFFDGQMFDANVLVEQLTSVAKERIVLIDDYVTAEILQRFHRCSPTAAILCYVKDRFKSSALEKVFSDFSAQYPSQRCELLTSDKSHDRWLIVDDDVYHFGASVKDLGKRWFSVDKQTEYSADELIARL